MQNASEVLPTSQRGLALFVPLAEEAVRRVSHGERMPPLPSWQA
jgi:hypothetical protein